MSASSVLSQICSICCFDCQNWHGVADLWSLSTEVAFSFGI